MTYDNPNDDPDEGEVTRSYKIHVYRKIEESKLMKFNYGNSPYGLIMRDTAITDKATAKNEFDKMIIHLLQDIRRQVQRWV